MKGMDLYQENLRKGNSFLLKILLGLALAQLAGFGGSLLKVWPGDVSSGAPVYLLAGAIVLGIAIPVCKIIEARGKHPSNLEYFLFALFLLDLGAIIYALGNHIFAHYLWMAPVALTCLYFNPKLTVFATGWAVLEFVLITAFLPLSADLPGPGLLITIVACTIFLAFTAFVYIVRRNKGVVDSLLAVEKEGTERFFKLQETLSQVISSGRVLSEVGRELAANAGQVDSSASVIGRNTATCAEDLQRIMQVIEENKDTLDRNKGYTLETVRIVEGIVSNAQSGVVMTAEMDEVIAEFKGKLSQTFATFRESGDEFIKIETIVETVNDISNQINLLSLNAAIEAARAGDEGRGFSVIAETIQNLSNQTRDALNRIKEIITTVSEQTEKIQKESKKTQELFGKVLEVVMSVHGNIAAIAKRLNEKTPVLLKLTEYLQAQTQILGGINQQVSGVYDCTAKAGEEVETLLTMIDGVKQAVGNLTSAAAELFNLSQSLPEQEEAK